MIPADHVSPQETCSSEQDASFNEPAATLDNHATAVPAESTVVNMPELSRNQVAVTSPNTTVNLLRESYDSDDWSTSTDSYEKDHQGQLVECAPNGVNELHETIGNGPTIVNTFTGNTNLHPNFNDTRIYKGPVTIHQNIYCCPSTLLHGLKSCLNKRYIANLVVTTIAISIFITLGIWFPKRHMHFADANVRNKTDNTDHSSDIIDLAPTSPSYNVVYVSTEVLPTESTTELCGNSYSYNTTGQKNEGKTEIVPLNTITRAEWDAAPPLKPLVKLAIIPAARVIISETSTESCDEIEKCTKLVRGIQRSHTVSVLYPDIAYNFLVSADGSIYEGLGWGVKGCVATYFDHESISIAFIGNFSLIEPPEKQVRAALKLIRFGVDHSNISMFFKLSGKKQLVYMSDNPGEKLYSIITKWQQWEPGTCFPVPKSNTLLKEVETNRLKCKILLSSQDV